MPNYLNTEILSDNGIGEFGICDRTQYHSSLQHQYLFLGFSDFRVITPGISRGCFLFFFNFLTFFRMGNKNKKSTKRVKILAQIKFQPNSSVCVFFELFEQVQISNLNEKSSKFLINTGIYEELRGF